MRQSPTPILLVNHEVEFGGAERSLCELLRGLDRERFSPSLVCSKDGPLAQSARSLGVAVDFVPMLFDGKLRKAIGLFSAARTLRSHIADRGIALVHANSLIAGYCSLRAAHAAGVPCVWHVRDLTYPALARFAVRRADWCIANSHATAAALDSGTRVSVVHNSVDAKFFNTTSHRAEVRIELGVPLHSRLVAMVGRLDRWKGHRLLIEAAAELSPRLPDVNYLIIGGVVFDRARRKLQTYPDELIKQATELGIQDRIRFLGNRDDVPRLLAGCDLLVHPALEPEPFGRAIAEAQAVGLPVVAADHGGIPELLTHGQHGLLVPPRDRAGLAAAMGQLLADGGLRKQMGAAAREHACAHWTTTNHARAVEAVYQRVLPPRQPSADPEPRTGGAPAASPALANAGPS